MKIAVFPGSFDPLTLGHTDLIDRGLLLFDKLIVGIGENSSKQYMSSLAERMSFIQEHYKNEERLEVKSYSGLTVDFCKKEGANFILRGLRNGIDFEYEKPIAQMNYKMSGIESYFLLCKPELSAINSSIVRDIARNGGDISAFVPPSVQL